MRNSVPIIIILARKCLNSASSCAIGSIVPNTAMTMLSIPLDPTFKMNILFYLTIFLVKKNSIKKSKATGRWTVRNFKS